MHNNIVVELCPKEFPYAFMGGDYCCKTAKENTFIEMDIDTIKDISRCNGGPISLSSVCCESNNFKKCPSDGKCKSSQGKIKLQYI